MKALWLIAWLALASACSSYGVRCDTRLRPINAPQSPADIPAKRGAGPSSGGASPEKP
ncbi:MAG: hypothetical protein ACREU6_01230 [Steroidobacteraceae bacterium]